MPRVVVLPGNGGCDVHSSNFYGWLVEKIRHSGGEVEAKNMPDPVVARESKWIPFMETELKCDQDTLIVGHSSGAEAAMRYAETHKVWGLILVSACTTDLGCASEKLSGYYDRPWEWQAIKSNTCRKTILFGSDNDPFIPLSETEEIAQALDCDFRKLAGRGHFMDRTFPELAETIIHLLDL